MKPTIRVHYQMATVMNPFYCRLCWNANPRVKLSFAMEICKEHNIFPYFRVPFFKQKLRARVKKHYIQEHPEWEII